MVLEMEKWELTDGTTVTIGGRVTGDTNVANSVRATLAAGKAGKISSRYGAAPHYEPLDVDVPHLLDCFLRSRFDVVSGPVVEYPKQEPRPEPPSGGVY